jgi:Kef-type K+ transport system membrane component KefB
LTDSNIKFQLEKMINWFLLLLFSLFFILVFIINYFFYDKILRILRKESIAINFLPSDNLKKFKLLINKKSKSESLETELNEYIKLLKNINVLLWLGAVFFTMIFITVILAIYQ